LIEKLCQITLCRSPTGVEGSVVITKALRTENESSSVYRREIS